MLTTIVSVAALAATATALVIEQTPSVVGNTSLICGEAFANTAFVDSYQDSPYNLTLVPTNPALFDLPKLLTASLASYGCLPSAVDKLRYPLTIECGIQAEFSYDWALAEYWQRLSHSKGFKPKERNVTEETWVCPQVCEVARKSLASVFFDTEVCEVFHSQGKDVQ